MENIKHYRIGKAIVTRVTEQVLDAIPAGFLIPEWDDQVAQENAAWMAPQHMSTDRQNLILSIHTWVVKTERHTILIDTASGNGKERPLNPIFHRLDTPYLERLADAGVHPDEVDFVLTTHLHIDHVGWNTVLKDGAWVPTFKNAKYVFSKDEYAFYADPVNVRPPSAGVFEDSVQPVVDAGLAVMVDADGVESIEGLAFHRTKGHSFDHLSISLSSEGEHALFSGDVMHNPIQIARPAWNSVFCEFQDDARLSRKWALDYAADKEAMFFSSHFAGSSAGRIVREGDAYTWHQQ